MKPSKPKALILDASLKLTEPRARATVINAISDAQAQDYRGWTIDTLLTHPHDAILFASRVLRALHRPVTRDTVHQICVIAMNARKAGKLSSGGSRD